MGIRRPDRNPVYALRPNIVIPRHEGSRRGTQGTGEAAYRSVLDEPALRPAPPPPGRLHIFSWQRMAHFSLPDAFVLVEGAVHPAQYRIPRGIFRFTRY
jgi:hypothetical protein